MENDIKVVEATCYQYSVYNLQIHFSRMKLKNINHITFLFSSQDLTFAEAPGHPTIPQLEVVGPTSVRVTYGVFPGQPDPPITYYGVRYRVNLATYPITNGPNSLAAQTEHSVIQDGLLPGVTYVFWVVPYTSTSSGERPGPPSGSNNITVIWTSMLILDQLLLSRGS